jgi:hypothetical protein
MAVLDTGSSTSGKANVDSNYNLQVNLPTTPSQAGFAQTAYVASTAGSTNTKVEQITEDGGAVSAEGMQLMDLTFNSAVSAWNNRIGTNATTMTKATTNGFMRLNSGSSTTTTTGISIYTNQIFVLRQGSELRVTFNVKHTNATATNKQMEWGLGFYNFAAGQANAMNEFIGFRITAGGVLLGVVAYTTGGAPSESTVNINGGTPFTDGQAKKYEVRISNRKAEFWANDTFQNTIAIAADVYSILKSASYPVIARVFNSGVPSAAPILDVGQITVTLFGPSLGHNMPTLFALSDRGSYNAQPELGVGSPTFTNIASGTVPTAATGSNTASVFNSGLVLGGWYRMNGASFNVATHNNILVLGYQNPSLPTANGAGNNGRDFLVTSVSIAPQIITTALTGGPMTAIWFVSTGATALSLATTEADGTTAIAQRAPKMMPFPRTFSFAAAAALGTIETSSGDPVMYFDSPLVVHPGEFLCVGCRLITITAVTAGTIDGGISVHGYWA